MTSFKTSKFDPAKAHRRDKRGILWRETNIHSGITSVVYRTIANKPSMYTVDKDGYVCYGTQGRVFACDAVSDLVMPEPKVVCSRWLSAELNEGNKDAYINTWWKAPTERVNNFCRIDLMDDGTWRFTENESNA